MKKLLLILTLLLIPYGAQAGGIYDGVWQITDDIFATVNQNGAALEIILPEGDIWEAQLGTLVGNEATVVTVFGDVNLSARVVFTSLNTAVVTILSCGDTSIGICLFSAGTELTAIKIF